MIVAKTILAQLGGRRFLIMTGSKNLIASKDSLMMTLTRNEAKVNKLIIKLEVNDTYTLTFLKVGKVKGELVADIRIRHKDIYNDQLQEIFTKSTGLYTHL